MRVASFTSEETKEELQISSTPMGIRISTLKQGLVVSVHNLATGDVLHAIEKVTEETH